MYVEVEEGGPGEPDWKGAAEGPDDTCLEKML